MSRYSAPELARGFRTVRTNTVRIAEDIPAEQYGFRPAPGTRTVAETLAHIVVSPRWQQRAHGNGVTFLSFQDFSEGLARSAQEEAALTTKAAIVDALKQEGDEFATWLESLSDEALMQTVGFPPPVQPATKTRMEMLLSVKEHEMHHRGQLMLVERLLGIVPHITRQHEANQAAMREQIKQPQGA